MKANRHLRIAVGLYGIIWAMAVITFWLFYKNSQMAMLHVVVVQYVVMPVVPFISSIFVGKVHLPTKYVWLMPVCFSVAYLLYGPLTLSLSQYLLADVMSIPEFFDFLTGLISSAIGIPIGIALGKKPRNQFDETVIHMRAKPFSAWLSLI